MSVQVGYSTFGWAVLLGASISTSVDSIAYMIAASRGVAIPPLRFLEKTFNNASIRGVSFGITIVSIHALHYYFKGFKN
jgi:hypothetical protein